MKINYPLPDVHTLSVEELLQLLNTDVKVGLTEVEAVSRTEQFGANMYELQKQKSIWLVLLLQFKSPLVYLLVAATIVTLYFKNYMEAGAIGIVILVNALIGFLMELQARISMNALREMDITLVKVMRDAKVQEIASEKLTVGDVILLEAGDVIPGDGRLIELNQLQCDESSLTGESIPSLKNLDHVAKETVLGDRHNMVFKGASVMSGTGKAVITGIAQHTELGTITTLVQNAQHTATPLDKKLNALSKKLIWITLFMTGIFAITGVIQGNPLLLIFETAIALAVAAFPEGLPIVSTVALAYGMLLMAKRNVIVKKLAAVETLGSTNVILTDKTGTLTENTIHVDTISFIAEEVKVHIENNQLQFDGASLTNSLENFEKLKLIGILCNNAIKKNEQENDHLLGDPLDIALVNLWVSTGANTAEIKNNYKRVAEIPFNADIKMMGTLHATSTGKLVAAKGSLEHLLMKCKRIQNGATVTALKESDQKKLFTDAEHLAAQGLRVLAFAYNEATDIKNENFIDALIYVGMIGFLDPPRLDVKEAMLTCRKAGIKIVMITGDHPLTALNIAKKTGLIDEQEQTSIIGKDLPAMEMLTNEWKEKILRTAVFARTTPKQKLEIASIFQEAGNIVAMTGDGVNDAPALKKADIGIAMGLRGTPVAKETASIVIKDDSFASIAQAVANGREIFRNIKKFVIYLVSCNLSEIFIVTVMGFIAPSAVLLPLQILFLNMVTDVFPALALGLGKGDKTVMENPPRDPTKNMISNTNWLSITLYAVTITLSVIAAILYCKTFISNDDKILNNIGFVTLAFAQLFHVFNMSSRKSAIFINEVTSNKFIWLALFICAALMLMVFAVTPIRLALGLVVLSAKAWFVALLAALLPLIIVQVSKMVRRLGAING